jgi:hypothetical protein
VALRIWLSISAKHSEELNWYWVWLTTSFKKLVPNNNTYPHILQLEARWNHSLRRSASDPKVQFSLKNWRKTILKTVQRNTNSPGTPERAHARRRARVPRQRPYARRACTPRHRRTQRSMRRAGKPLWVTTASGWMAPGGQFPLAGVPTAASHWPRRRRTSQRLAAHAARSPATWLTTRPPNRP